MKITYPPTKSIGKTSGSRIPHDSNERDIGPLCRATGENIPLIQPDESPIRARSSDVDDGRTDGPTLVAAG